MGRLFWKFFLFTMLAQILATISVGGTFWLKEVESRKRYEQLDLGPIAEVQIDSAMSTLEFGGVSALRDLLGRIDGYHEIFAVDDSDHDLLGRAVDPVALAEARNALRPGIERREIQLATTDDGRHFLLFGLARPIGKPRFEARDVGAIPIQYRVDHALPMKPPNEMEHGPMQPFQPFLGIATAILGSLIFAWLLARYFSKPIRSLRLAFESIAIGNLNTRLGPVMGKRRDELADLGRDFDTMAERLRTLVEGQRRMLHDVSHELRSPLTRLQVAIGLARQSPDKIEASLTRIERESVRMEKLVSELLTLSRLDASGHLLANDEIDFGELVMNIIEDAKFEAEANGRALEFVGDSAAYIKGDTELLYRAVENVVRNAVKYTALGTTVMVDAQLDLNRNEVHLSVLDRGPGVPAEELNLIFEPFFRGAATERSLDGHGLGLAIAVRVVNNHGGRLVAFNRQGGGLVVKISLPIIVAHY